MSPWRGHVAWTGKMHMRGFTLVELLVVMALLSLLMLGLVSALRTMAQTEERIDGRLAQADEFRVTTAFVQEILGQISIRKKQDEILKQGGSPFLFDGQTGAVAWVGIMPARHGVGRLYFFRLGLEGFGGEAALVIRFAPWDESAVFPNWEQAQARTLLKGVTSFALSYEDVTTEPGTWTPTWQGIDSLPEHVRLDVQTRSGDWPLWIVATRQLAQGGRRQGGYSRGPE